MSKSVHKPAIVVAMAAVFVYGNGYVIALAYHEIVYLLQEGFLDFLFFGWIVPIFRAIDWPLDLFRFFFS